MNIVKTTAASMGRLGLAAAAFGAPALYRRSQSLAHDASGASAAVAGPVVSPLPEVLLNGIIAAGWLSERKTLLSRHLNKETLAMVTAKDVLVAGTVLTGLARLAGQEVMRRNHLAETPSSPRGDGDPNAAVDTEYRRYFRTCRTLNRIFALSGVAATPFINFALFDSYQAHPIRSMFSL